MSMIRPTGNGGVRIDGGGSMGMGNEQQQQQQQQQQNPMNIYRSFMEQGSTSSGGGIKWEKYGANGTIDQGLQDIINDSSEQTDVTQILAASVSQANLVFINHILSRSGKFYEVYRHTVDQFRVSDVTMKPCPVRDAFIKMFQRHQEFTKPVALNASIMFGWSLICFKRQNNQDDIPSNQYLRSAEQGIRSILFMEMVQWLMKTTEGQQHARQLPKDLKDKMPNLDAYNQVIDTASAAFNVNNPYAGITFEVTTPVRNDLASNQYDSRTADTLYGGMSSFNTLGTPEHQNDAMRALDEQIAHRARLYNQRQRENSDNYGYTDDQEYYNNQEPVKKRQRDDYENLTPGNKHQFRIVEHLRCVGKANTYFIREHDWKNIQKAFKRHPDQGPEETVFGDAFRIVYLDLDADDGWTSTIVRTSKYSMTVLLSNPEKLLPLLEDNNSTGYYSVVNKTMDEVKAKETLVIDVEEAVKLEGSIPSITFNEKVVSNKPEDIVNTVNTVSRRLTKNIKDMSAVCYNATIWDTFTFNSQEEKERLFKDIPFLFKDNTEKQPSFFMACKTLQSYFNTGRLDKEVCQFIDGHLTQLINNYLINSAGYPAYSHETGFLSVDSIVDDYDELDEEFNENDPIMYGIFNNDDGDHYLVEALKIFTFNDKYLNRSKKASVVERTKAEQELVVERPLYITSINKSQGPSYDKPNQPVLIKRSQFPEYFKLVEDSFDKTMGKASFDSIDKVLHFVSTDQMWLFNYSAIDKNVATLRHINVSGSLVLLEVD